ncbi:MAG: aminotransferase class I/II-fold pyridoxal phosphate-dependent enzyme [Planctomycetota bacterium]
MRKILADRTKVIDASGIRRVFALASQMKDPINFSIGQPDFDVPDELKSAAIRAIESGANKYTQTAGEDSLREKISSHVVNEFGWPDCRVLVTSGVSGGLLLVFMALVNPGDEVIMVDPYFVIYKHIVRMLGGRCVFVESYPDFELPVTGIKTAITDRTKMIIVNSPANPTGVVYSAGELQQLAEVAAARDIIVMSDEIYEKFCYDGPCASICRYYSRTILLRGFGKAYGMTGWRMGYAAVNESLKDVLEEMTKIQQYTFVCAPSAFQHAAAAALDYDMSGFVAGYRKKRDMIYAGLKDKFEVVRPGGAFYIFVKAPGGSGTKFVEKAIANRVLVIPGNVFSEKDTHFRVSYATSDEKIARGIEILNSIG